MVKCLNISRRIRIAALLASVCLLSSFFSFQNGKPLRAWHLNGQAQGTTYHITYYGADSIINIRQIDSILNQIDSSLSLYKPYSLINRFNASSSGIEVDKHFVKVAEKSLEVFKNTGGTFDITVKPLVAAWGFGVKRGTNIPDSATVKTILKCVGSEKLRLKGKRLIKTEPCIEIDVNGIAQGYSVDVLADFLEEKGIANYLVELGGEIRVKGVKKPQNKPMRIGIEAPDGNAYGAVPIGKVLELTAGAITTSGNYRQFHQSGNTRISHLIDPKSGYSYQNELISVTVYAPDAITADAYDNALMGMGLEKALQFVKKNPYLAAYFIYQKPDGTVADTASANFPRLIQPE